MQTRVRDVMTTEVVAVEEKTAFKDVVQVMRRARVSAVPVLDSTGRVCGVLSESDLLVKQADPDAAEEVRLSPRRRREQRKAEGAVAGELMSSPPVTTTPAASVKEAATRMCHYKIDQLPVVDDEAGRLVGIVGRADVLGVYRRPDADLRAAVLNDVIAGEFVMDPARFAVEVVNGRVTVRGTVERRSLIPLLTHSIRHVEGVVSVTARLDHDLDDSYIAVGPYL